MVTEATSTNLDELVFNYPAFVLIDAMSVETGAQEVFVRFTFC